MTGNRSPGFARKPDYALEIAPAGKTVRVRIAGETIAESANAFVMREGKYDPVYYVPQADVRLDLLTKTDHSSHCPFKGDASYWSISAGARTEENAVWAYEAPFDEVAEIAGAMAFYGSKVDAIETVD